MYTLDMQYLGVVPLVLIEHGPGNSGKGKPHSRQLIHLTLLGHCQTTGSAPHAQWMDAAHFLRQTS